VNNNLISFKVKGFLFEENIYFVLLASHFDEGFTTATF